MQQYTINKPRQSQLNESRSYTNLVQFRNRNLLCAIHNMLVNVVIIH